MRNRKRFNDQMARGSISTVARRLRRANHCPRNTNSRGTVTVRLAASNPEPDRAWRLAFNAEQLHDAWSRRGKDGHPLLVPPSLLDRTDWPVIAERARRSQYELVHPAVAMARSAPPEVGVSEAERIFERRFPNLPDTIEGEAEDIRFKKEGEQLPWGPKIPVG